MKLSSVKTVISRQCTQGARSHSLVILHGLMGNKNNWSTITHKLQRHPLLQEASSLQSIHTVDARNHGGSFHSQQHDLFSMASDIKQYLLSSEIPTDENIILMGHSMGAMALMVFLLQYLPTEGIEEGQDVDLKQKGIQVNLGIIVDIGLANENNENSETGENGETDVVRSPREMEMQKIQSWLNAMLRVPLEKIHSLADAHRFVASDIPDEALRSFLLTNLKFAPPNSNRPSNSDSEHGVAGGGKGVTAQWKCNLPVLCQSLSNLKFPYHHFQSRGTQTSVPVGFIFGGDSPYFTGIDSVHRDAQNFFLQREEGIEVISKAAHFVHYQQPDEFLKRICPWLVKYCP